MWWSPIKLTLNPTPLKPFKEYQFANNTSSSTPPTTSSSLWIDSPTPLTTAGQHMWMRARTVTYNTIMPTNPPTNPNYIEPYSYGAWETPSRITKLTGYSSIDINSAIRFNPNGSGYLANGNILWDTIGNTTIKGIYKSNNEEILLRPNGSGHLASGNISWKENGDLTVLGTFKSNNSGNKIIIDPLNRRLEFKNTLDKTSLNLSFVESGNYSASRIDLYKWINSTTSTANAELRPDVFALYTDVGNFITNGNSLQLYDYRHDQIFKVQSTDNTQANRPLISVIIKYLFKGSDAQASADLLPGSLYVDNNNFLKVLM